MAGTQYTTRSSNKINVKERENKKPLWGRESWPVRCGFSLTAQSLLLFLFDQGTKGKIKVRSV